MSKLGYIQKSYGTETKIAIANTYGSYVLSGSNLPSNTLIIASPIDENNDDTGSYSLLITDSIGTPVRLTYTLREGTGILYSDDSLKVNIDNLTIIDDNHQLKVNLNKLIDNYKIQYESGKIVLNQDNLTKATYDTRGIFAIDEKTIKLSDERIYVDTSNLHYANTEAGIAGICIGDGETIISNQGVLTLNEDKINIATSENFGRISGNNDTVKIENGHISVITQHLKTCNANRGGIVIPDNNTIEINNNSELSVNYQNLQKASSTSLGVFKYDENNFYIDDDSLKIKDYSKFNELINNLIEKESSINEQINDIDYLLSEYQIGINKPEIFDFHCANLLTTVLEKPIKLNQSINEMNMQFISTDFIVSTNCPFIISLKFEDNIDPGVMLYSINYDDINIYNGNSGLIEIFQTTQEREIPIKFTFIAKNYYNNDKTNYSVNTKIKITVSYVNDITVNKSIIYSIVRFNSGYNEEIEYENDNIDKYI